MLVDSNCVLTSSPPSLSSGQADVSFNLLSGHPPDINNLCEGPSDAGLHGGQLQGPQYTSIHDSQDDNDDHHNRSCCCDADDMAGDEDRAEKYIIDIPYSVLWSIVQSLDADKGWEALAAETGYTFDKIRLLELEGSRAQGSPTRSLLWELGSRNTTIRRLYGYLSAIRRFREMKILENYVNSAAPSSSFSEGHGLKGLKTPESSMDTSHSLKGLKPPNMSSLSDKKGLPTTSMCSDSINFNQPVSAKDTNSLKLVNKDKQELYTGKQMPAVASESQAASSNVLPDVKSNLGCIQAPNMKPSTAPGIKDIFKQLPGDRSSSGSTSSSSSSSSNQHATISTCPSRPTATSPTPSPLGDIPASSSLSSMSGLDSFPTWLDSSVEMQVAAIGSACFTYNELRQATDDFSDNNKLGEGAFGTVYFGLLRHTKCAVKKMAEVNNQDTCVERSSQVKREMTSLLKFRHENLVTLYGYALDGPYVCLVYQFMPNGSLEDRLLCKKGTSPLLWSQRLNILVGACQGLNFLHTMGQQPLIHGDIKSANILLDKHMEARIGDLGQAQQATARDGGSNSCRLTHITRAQATTKQYGTRAYQPTEVQSGGCLSVKSDIFAMGVVLLEVFSGQQAYDDRREGDRGLADYFRNNVSDGGSNHDMAKWLPQIDHHAGECHRDFAIAILQLAHQATSALKKQRPDSTKLLQLVICIEQMYKDVTGESAGQSLVGSEHSCHLSHTSSPDHNRDNLAGAPCQPTTIDIKGAGSSSSPRQTQKGVMSHDHPDNRLAVNLNKTDTITGSGHSGFAETHHQHLQTTTGTTTRSISNIECMTPSPIDYFPAGQPLPPAFRLQQEYDLQKLGQKQIARLSQCCPMQQDDALPPSDPHKLEQLQQFDRLNIGHDNSPDLDPHLQSDPKKLEALKQFDAAQQAETCAAIQAEQQEGELACDPKKLEYLKQFDEWYMAGGGGGDGLSPSQQQQEEAVQGQLASDPRKLRYLTEFDNDNVETATPETGDSFPVSQVDHVLTSQREALRACKESLHHAHHTSTPSHMANTRHSPLSAHPHDEADTAVFGTQSTLLAVSGGKSLQSGEEQSAAMLALRQKDFFQKYQQAVQGMSDGECGDDYEYDDGEMDEELEAEDAMYGVGDATEASPVHKDLSITEPNLQQPSPLSVSRSASPLSHHHPAPTEQDEDNSNLNHFKERVQYYSKTFKKTSHAS